MRLAWFAALCLGCSVGVELPCRDGSTLAGDGHCYPDHTPTVAEYLNALDACEPLGARGELNPQTGCASGACAGMTYSEINGVLLEDGACQTASNASRVHCYWSVGLNGYFVDGNQDQVPDGGAETHRIYAFPPYTGALSEGAGVGTVPSCFLQELGEPDWVVLQDVEGTHRARELHWWELGVELYDRGTDDLTGVPDGRIDEIYLFGGS